MLPNIREKGCSSWGRPKDATLNRCLRNQERGGRERVMARFGLVPWWSKTEKVGWSTMNAPSESAAQKPAFSGCVRAPAVVLSSSLGDL